jgi:hypothetical protein
MKLIPVTCWQEIGENKECLCRVGTRHFVSTILAHEDIGIYVDDVKGCEAIPVSALDEIAIIE